MSLIRHYKKHHNWLFLISSNSPKQTNKGYKQIWIKACGSFIENYLHSLEWEGFGKRVVIPKRSGRSSMPSVVALAQMQFSKETEK